MSLSSAIKLGRLISVEEVQEILTKALAALSHDARENCELYSEADKTSDCPGEKSCSVEDIVLAVTTATWEHFQSTLWDEFENVKAYAIR